MKIVTIVGARPQFIKAAMVSRAVREYGSAVHEVILHTGQHYDSNMSEVFFQELNISPPDYNLGIGGGTHGQNTGRMIEAIEAVMLAEKPDWVIVYGDTDSTLAGTLAAVKLHIPVAHVEAGMRSFNRKMPEEFNRILTDHASNLLFTPTVTATGNLLKEGVPLDRVRQVGDVMYDAALYYGEQASRFSRILGDLKISPKDYILATVHRSENTENPEWMANIVAGFAQSNQQIIWPLHPRTRLSLHKWGLKLSGHVRAIEPVGYFDMVMLEKKARLVATDSGGVQKEAFFFGVPCVTLRNETEWMELIEVGANKLAGLDPLGISASLNDVFTFPAVGKKIFGDGDASIKIINDICKAC